MADCARGIDCFPDPANAALCHLDAGHGGMHQGSPANPDYSATVLHWADDDRRCFTVPHPGRCGTAIGSLDLGIAPARCVFPVGHHGSHAG